MTTVQQEVVNYLEETLSTKIELENNLYDDLKLDSLDVIELNIMLEEKFNIVIEDDFIKNILTVQELINKIRSKFGLD